MLINYLITLWAAAALLNPLPAESNINTVETTVIMAHDSRVNHNVILKTVEVWVTAYSSSPDETDDTPDITASQTQVRDGIIAANFLPFGTRVRIPELFDDKIFVVEDRMHRRKTNFIDIWMPTKSDAKKFGIHYTAIDILN